MFDMVRCGLCKSLDLESGTETFIKTNQYGSKISVCVCYGCEKLKSEILNKNGYVKHERKS